MRVRPCVITAMLAVAAAPATAQADATIAVPIGKPSARLAFGAAGTPAVSDGRRSIVVGTRTHNLDPTALVIVDTATGRRRRVPLRMRRCLPDIGGAGHVVLSCGHGAADFLLNTATLHIRRVPDSATCQELPTAMGAHWLLLFPFAGTACDHDYVAVNWRTGARHAFEVGTAIDLDARAFTSLPTRETEFTRDGRYVSEPLVGNTLHLELVDHDARSLLAYCGAMCHDADLTGAGRVSWVQERVNDFGVGVVRGYALDGGRRPRYAVRLRPGGPNVDEAVHVTNTSAALVISTVRRFLPPDSLDTGVLPLTWRVWLAPWPSR